MIEPTRPMTILLVDDDALACELIVHQMRDFAGDAVALVCEQDLEGALSRLEVESFDAVLLDLHLPDAVGMEGLERIQEVNPDVPVLFLTGDENEAVAYTAISHGAQEYLVKRYADGESIVKAVRFAIERQRLTLELEEAHREQLELRSQLLSNVSHELRTPLATVHQFVAIVADGLAGELNSTQKEYLDIVLANTDRLNRMIGDLLDASRAANGRLHVEARPVLLGPLVDHVLRSQSAFADRRGITLASEVGAELPEVDADPQRVVQVLTNLTDNAMKFAKGGSVTVGADVDAEAGCVEVRVTDTGCGIAPEARDRIFERLYQSGSQEPERAGLGLGLHICKFLVERLGGKIWLASELGRGSTFFFTLPISDSAASKGAGVGRLLSAPSTFLLANGSSTDR